MNMATLSAKVSEKGAVSVYGVRSRFPVTFYQDEWLLILAHGEKIKAFIKANKKDLKEAKDSSSGGPQGTTAL
jgi:hypothetical protein